MKRKTRKPSKQRKRLYNAPQHRRGQIFSAHLSSGLSESHGARSIPLRTGDTVRVLRGDYKGYEGKVLSVDRRKQRVSIEGINREKADGSSMPVPIHPSKVEIVHLNLDDKWRSKILERKAAPEELEAPVEKPTEEGKQATSPENISEVQQVEGER